MRVGANDIDLFARLDLEQVGLRLRVDDALGGDQLHPGIPLPGLDGAAQHADGLARVQAPLAAAAPLRVLPAHQDDALAIGQLQVLPGDQAQVSLGGNRDQRVLGVRQLFVHARHAGLHGFQGRRLLVEFAGIRCGDAHMAGVGDRFVRFGGSAEGVAQHHCLLQ
ncbi:hypothetical protein JANLI_53960 [Janthinobacterium lividum]|nr:hypothetical protein JANLI_53960 [Janthinobacterium lividum]